MDQPDSIVTTLNSQGNHHNNSNVNLNVPKSAQHSNDNVLHNQSMISGATADSSNAKASKRPKNTALKQQRLPAWQPILTAKTVLPLFFVIGVIFVVLGGVLLHYSNLVNEYVVDYTECMSDADPSQPCSKIANATTRCQCSVAIKLERDFDAPVYMYYGLKNFYQNHRRYVKSRDDNQLLGAALKTVNTECKPYDYPSDNTSLIYAPCGAIANSLFNDSFTVNYIDVSPNKQLNLLATGIAWNTDKSVKFKNPASWANTIKPVNWQKNVWDLSTDPDNNGYKNEDLIVWMRTAALPTFRKFYRRVDHATGAEFASKLPAGNYRLVIDYNYPVTMFDGRKSFIISTTTWIGGKNPFLGIAYLVVGSLCICLGFVFLIIHFKFSRNTKQSDDLNKPTVATIDPNENRS